MRPEKWLLAALGVIVATPAAALEVDPEVMPEITIGGRAIVTPAKILAVVRHKVAPDDAGPEPGSSRHITLGAYWST